VTGGPRPPLISEGTVQANGSNPQSPGGKPFGAIRSLKGAGSEKTDIGAASTIERLYREEGRKLWWALVAYSGDREVASDALAEAFAQAIARGDALADPLAWIWRVAFRVAAGELRRRSRTDHRVPEVSDPGEQRAVELVSVLGQLPPNQRAAIVLHYYADRPVRDIAATLRVSSATARVHLHRGRRRLRQLLGEEHG
jgi:RNA polymerase sigma factor (sigma-70 family)